MQPSATGNNTNTALRVIAEQYVRTMLSYYVMRSLLEDSMMAEAERAAIRSSAIETRTYGFRLESKPEPLGLCLEASNDEILRKEAALIARQFRTNETEARQQTERVVATLLAHTFESEQDSFARVA